MSETLRVRTRCSICRTTARVAYDSSLGELKVVLEHLDDDVHNIVPVREDGTRGQSALLLEPDVEQHIWPWQLQ